MNSAMDPPLEPPRRPRSRELGADECENRLTSTHVGRIAWLASDGLQLLPVSYAWHQYSAVFRTSAYGTLSELVHPTEVVMEVDDLNPERQLGWSVVIRGVAAGVAEPADLVQLWAVDGLTPWAEGVRSLFIQLQPRQITGRRFDVEL